MSINGSHQSSSRSSADRECTSFSSKVLLTSSTASNHTADETDESVLQRWSQETCVFSTDIQKGGWDALMDFCIYIHLEEDKQRWIRSACVSQCHKSIRFDLFWFLTDVINESENCCDARGIAFPRHFFCHVHSSAMLRHWKSVPGDWLLQSARWSAAEMEISGWRIWRVPSNFPVLYRTIRITAGEKLSSAEWKH